MSTDLHHLSPQTLLSALEGLGEVAPATVYQRLPGFAPRTVRRAMATLVASGAVVATGSPNDPSRTYRAVAAVDGADPEPAAGMTTDDDLVAARHDRLSSKCAS